MSRPNHNGYTGLGVDRDDRARSAAGADPEPAPLFVTVVAPAQLARTLFILRERHGWSTRTLAARAGLSPATINRAERGHNVDATTLVALTTFIRQWWWREATP